MQFVNGHEEKARRNSIFQGRDAAHFQHFTHIVAILTFFYLAVEVNGVHGGSNDVGVTVPSCDDPGDFIHQLHGHTCPRNTCTF